MSYLAVYLYRPWNLLVYTSGTKTEALLAKNGFEEYLTVFGTHMEIKHPTYDKCSGKDFKDCLEEIDRVNSAKREELPLLIDTLKTEYGLERFNERLKEEKDVTGSSEHSPVGESA